MENNEDISKNKSNLSNSSPLNNSHNNSKVRLSASDFASKSLAGSSNQNASSSRPSSTMQHSSTSSNPTSVHSDPRFSAGTQSAREFHSSPTLNSSQGTKPQMSAYRPMPKFNNSEPTGKSSPSPLTTRTASPTPSFASKLDEHEGYGVSREIRERRKIEEKNKKLIDEIRNNQQLTKQKKKKNNNFWIWIVLLLLFLGGGTAGIVVVSLKNEPPEIVVNPISIEIQGDFNFYGTEAENVMPGTSFDKQLWVKNTSTNSSGVYIRFYVESYVNNQKSNIPLASLIPYISSNFVKSSNNILYYKGILTSEETLQIISGIIIQGTNHEANQGCTHKIIVDAVESYPSSIYEVWPDAPGEWSDYMRTIS